MSDTSYTDLNLFHTVHKDASCSTIKRTTMTKHCYGIVFYPVYCCDWVDNAMVGYCVQILYKNVEYG